MDSNKAPLQKLFRQAVSLEELRIAETVGQPEQATSNEKSHLPRHHHYLSYAFTGLSAVLLVTGLWLVTSISFSKILVGKTELPATASDQRLGAEFRKQAATYQLTIERPDKTRKQFKLEDLGLSLNQADSVKAARSQQNQFGPRLRWWKPVKADLVLNKNSTALNNFISREVNIAVQPSKDAVLTIENGQIKVADAVAGKSYGLIRPRTDLTTAVRTLDPAPVKLRTLKTMPPLTAKILEPYKANLEKTINQPISLKVGTTVVKPTPADIAGWLEITPDSRSKKVDISVNSGKVLEYINKVAAGSIHPPKAQIEVRRGDGSTDVLVPGVSGLDVGNKQETATDVAAKLLDGAGLDMSLNVSYQNYKTVTTDSYPKWIEVDITNKRLYAYERDTLVRTELVSAGAPATPTVTGQFSIYAKYTQQDMRGSNVDGSSYFQPNVKWISYFYRDYALHGNYWRPLNYFGNINSSHGCVSMVEPEAEWLYNWAPVGTPVIVHT